MSLISRTELRYRSASISVAIFNSSALRHRYQSFLTPDIEACSFDIEACSFDIEETSISKFLGHGSFDIRVEVLPVNNDIEVLDFDIEVIRYRSIP